MALTMEQASFGYADGKTIFRDIGFSVEPGEIFCLLGPNGAGKSTLIRCLNRLLPLSRGTVALDGQNIATLPRKQIARRIGYVPQSHIPAFPYPVFDVVLMGRSARQGMLASPGKQDRAAAEQALATLRIEHLAAKPYTQISGGERQLVLLAAVLAQAPDYLLLDEPTSHLDFGNQIRLLGVINELAGQGIGVIMTTHFPDHAFLTAGTVAILKEGGLVAAGPAAQVITEANIRNTYNIDVIIGPVAGRDDVITCAPVMRSGEKLLAVGERNN